MQDIKMKGIGKFDGGEFAEVCIEGVSECRGDMQAKKLQISGKFQCGGKIDAEEIYCEGMARIKNSIHAKKVKIDGYVAIENGDLTGTEILCGGALRCDGQISADHLVAEGYLDVKEIVGDKIEIYSTRNVLTRIFTRKGCRVNLIEATEIVLRGVRAKIVNGQNITVGRGCVIDALDCSGVLRVEENAVIHQTTGDFTRG